MVTDLVRELESLIKETRELLDLPDPGPEVWEEYRERREELFARIGENGFHAVEEKRALVRGLIEEFLRQNRAVVEKAEKRLAHLRGEISAAASDRRALSGYVRSRPAVLLQRLV